MSDTAMLIETAHDYANLADVAQVIEVANTFRNLAAALATSDTKVLEWESLGTFEQVQKGKVDGHLERDKLRKRIAELEQMQRTADDLLLAATDRLGMAPAGCDTAEQIATEIEDLRAENANLRMKLC